MPTTPRGVNVYRASQGMQPSQSESQESLPEPEASSQDSDRPLTQNWVCSPCPYCYDFTHVPFSPPRLLQKIDNALPRLVNLLTRLQRPRQLFQFKKLRQLAQNANTRPFCLTMPHP